MQRVILLQTEATSAKQKILSTFEEAATAEANRLLSERLKHRRFKDFWHGVGSESKRLTGFGSQVVCDLARGTWKKQIECERMDGVTVKFNVPRNCKTFKTRGFTFVELGLYPKKRIAVPIRKNRNWQRFSGLLGSGWACKTFGLTPDLQVAAHLYKADAVAPRRKNVLGVDVNSKCFAVSVLSPEGRVLRQLYLGKDIWERRRKMFERKSTLQSYADLGSRSATKKLRAAKAREHNFVKNRIGEVVRDVTTLALRHDAEVAIESLRRFSPKGKRFNRQVMRIPFYAFRRNLEQRCFDKGITLNTVDSWHTSKWCPHCGAVGRGHASDNYSLFRCKCGLVVNSDRKASLAIAAKSLLERGSSPNQITTFSLSGRRVPVNALLRPSPMAQSQMAVPLLTLERGKPASFSRG
ncbi:MAG: zinc ribbon domain-containing protein [Nitrososphaerales archaeon]|nr:zinc ribbon domain-containing protein [Nitrososphaerales archaeon]